MTLYVHDARHTCDRTRIAVVRGARIEAWQINGAQYERTPASACPTHTELVNGMDDTTDPLTFYWTAGIGL